MKSDQKRLYGVYSRLRFVEYIIDEDLNRARLGLRDKTFINDIKEGNIVITFTFTNIHEMTIL